MNIISSTSIVIDRLNRMADRDVYIVVNVDDRRSRH